MSPNKSMMRLIRTQMENNMLRSEGGRYFIQKSSIQAILTDMVIEKAVSELSCQPHDQIGLAGFISTEGVLLFAMLIWLKEEDFIIAFRSHNFGDRRLPLDEQLATRIVPDFGVQLAREEQWRFLPFHFSSRMADHHWEIDKNQIIPFVGKSIEVARGGFGDVFKVDIPSSQQGFFFSQATKVRVIRKKVRDQGDPDAGKHEMMCLRLLNQVNHPNIIRLLGSYTYEGELNFLFPCFDLALNGFLKAETRFGEFRYGLTFFSALRGLCSALMNTHSLRLNQSKHGINFEAVGYHHDIRPANILVSRDIFVLADFGLGNFKDAVARSQTPWTWTTGDYLAPECMDNSQKPQDVGRAIDVWAFACLTADLITYVHKGHRGVKEFSDARLSPGRNPKWEDSRFHAASGNLKDEVVNWIRGLPEHDSDGVPYNGLTQLVLQTLEKKPLERPRIDAIHGQMTFESVKAHFQAVRTLFSTYMTDERNRRSPPEQHVHALWFTKERFLAWGHALRLDAGDKPPPDISALCEVADKATPILVDLFRGLTEKSDPESFRHVAQLAQVSRLDAQDERQIDQNVESLWAILPRDVARWALDYWHNAILSIDDIDALDNIDHMLESQLTAFETSRALSIMKKIRLAIQTLDTRCLSEGTTSWMVDPTEVKVARNGDPYAIGLFKDSSPVLVEWMWYTSGWENVDSTQRSLVMSLRAQSFGISPKPEGLRTMDCVGVFEERSKKLGYGFVYQIPSGVLPSPTSLHDLFDHDNRSIKPQPALGDKFKLALALANFLKHFHTIGWLHQNFNSRNVLFFREDITFPSRTRTCPLVGQLEQPYVVGLHKSRPDGSLWQTAGPGSSDSSDYQHPDYARTGRYQTRFDYYSLGVVLLEISYWRSLDSLLSGSKYQQMGASEIQDQLISRCKTKLASKVGIAFRDVVLRCMEGDWQGANRDSNNLIAAETSSYRTVALGDFIDDVIQPLERLARIEI
ncbi:kinase-like protein [Xylariaceae sp. FL0255]|nr:kinase-like protein [Xylariaceae sp. FL0255]